MAKEQDFIEKLSNFTSALEDLVLLLKEQQKIGPTEVVNQLLESLDAEAIASLAKNIEEVKEKTIEINKNTEKILKAIQDQKKQKETGMFENISDEKNKNKIVDGVKTIILIAAGVLAIGMAFKIVGDVDFLSVVALGMGIMFVAMAFSKVAELKDDKGKPLSWKQIIIGAAALILISGALLVSGLILKQIPVLSIKETFTIVLVAASVGIATFFIMKGIDKVGFQDMAKAALIPTLLPLVALGIVGAAFALQGMPEVSLKQAFSALIVSIAMLPVFLGIGYMIKGLKNATMEDVIFAGLAMPIIATGILLSSLILQFVQPIPFFTVLLAGIAIGVAILAMIPTILLLNKVGLTKPEKIKDLAIGALAIVIISAAIAIASWILSAGNYDQYPSASWAFGVGLSLILFALPVSIIGFLVSIGVGLAALAAGVLGVVLVATAISLVSWIIGLGNYANFPSPDWASGVGLSMLLFGTPMVVLGAFIFGTFGFGLAMLAAGIAGVLIIAEAIVEADKILSKGKWGNYPGPDWSTGVGQSIRAFSEVLIELTKLQMLSDMVSFFSLGMAGGGEIDLKSFIIKTSEALLKAAEIFNSAPNIFGGNYPDEKWAKGVGLSIRAFSEVLIELTKLQMLSDMVSFFSLGMAGGEIDLKSFIIKTSEGLIEAAKIFNNNKDVKFEGNYPKEEWAKGVGGSLSSFAEAIAALKSAGVDIDADDLNDDDGAIAIMKGLSKGLIEVAKVFNENTVPFDVEKVPKKEWSEGIGSALKSFTETIKILKEADLDVNIKNIGKEDNAIGMLVGLSLGIILVGAIFNKFGGKFDIEKIPNKEWTDNVIAALTSFNSIGDLDISNIDNLISLSYSVYKIAIIFSLMNNLTLPDENFVKSLNLLINEVIYSTVIIGSTLNSLENFDETMYKIYKLGRTLFYFSAWMYFINEEFSSIFEGEKGGIADKIAKSIQIITEAIPSQEKIDPLWSLIGALTHLSNIPWIKLFDIYIVADTIGYLAKQISQINTNNIDAINRLSAGLHVMSIVDEAKLNSVLKAIEEKSETLSQVIDDSGFINQFFSKISRTIRGEGEKTTYSTSAAIIDKKTEKDTKSSFEEELLSYVRNIDENVSRMANISQEERQEKLESKNVEGEE